MAEQAKDIILEVKVNSKDAIQNILNYKEAIKELQKSNDDLLKEKEKGTIGEEKYKRALEENKAAINHSKAAIKSYENELKNNVKAQKEAEGSINSMRAQLSVLTKQYDSMSEEMRKSAEGTEFRDKINEITKELKLAEEETGRFYRNVGNYENSIKKAVQSSGLFGKSIIAMGDASKSSGGMINGLTIQAKSFFAAMMANPIIAILTVVIAIITALKKAIDSNAESTAKFKKIMEPVNALMKVLNLVLKEVVDWILKGAEAFMSFAMGAAKMLEKLPLIGKAFKSVNEQTEKYIDLAKQKKALSEAENEALIRNAEIGRDVAELREKIADKEKYSAKERVKFQEEINALEEESFEINAKLARQKHEIFEEEHKNQKLSNELERERAQLIADSISAEAAFNNVKAQGTKTMIRLQKEITADEKSSKQERANAHKEYMSMLKEQKDKEREAIRAAEDAAFSLIKESAEKQRAVINQNYDRQIEDLKRKLETEKNLNVVAKEAINATIVSLEQKRLQNIEKLSDESISNQIAKEQQRIELELAAVKEGTEAEHKLRLQSIEQNRKAEIQANSLLTEEMRQDESLINAKYDKLEQDERLNIRKETIQKQSDLLKNEMQNRILDVQKGTIEENEVRLQNAQEYYELLLSLDEENKIAMFGSLNEYTLAFKESRNEMIEAEIALQNKIQDSNIKQLQAAKAVGDGYKQLIESFAEDNESLAAFAKTIAIFNIGLSTAETFAAIPSMAAVGDPYTYALRVATAIGTAMANFAKAKNIISGSKQPRRPKFAKGGLVSGAGSGTSDSIMADLSKGESVNTAMTTSMFAPILSAFNQIGGGVPINVVETSQQIMGEEMLTRAFAAALEELPPPNLVYSEFKTFEGKVKLMEEISTL